MSKQNKNLRCPDCCAPALHPHLMIPGTNEPRVLIFQNKKPGKHQCMVCSGFYAPVTYEDTWQNHNEDLGWFSAESFEDDSVEGLLTDMQTLVFKWFSQFIAMQDAEEITREIMKRRKLLNATIEMIREEEG